jgi:ATP-dependent Lon protease
VVLPDKNAPDLKTIPAEIQKDLEIITISEVKEIIDRVGIFL